MNPFTTSREIPATPSQIFAAISDPARLARGWESEGFTNTFEFCEFKPGGRWVFVMHAPDGTNYPNENRFVEKRRLRRQSRPHHHPRQRTKPRSLDGRGVASFWVRIEGYLAR
jgi:hypothetical protein